MKDRESEKPSILDENRKRLVHKSALHELTLLFCDAESVIYCSYLHAKHLHRRSSPARKERRSITSIPMAVKRAFGR